MAPGAELRLSNLGQLELLRGVNERGVALRATARGFSMAPFIRDRDVVTVAPFDGRGVRVGDVVAVELPDSGRLAIHRVVARAGAGWLVRGDDCRQADGVIGRSDILGRVVRVERDGREVRLGVRGGADGALVAALSRSGGLTGGRALWRLPRRAAASSLRRVQGVPAYRAAGRRLAPRIEIVEAGEGDMGAVHRRLAPGEVPVRPAPALRVTDWVAKRGSRPVGLVQLVDRRESEGAWPGHWLHSLTVWGQYRGLGVGEALTRQVIGRARRDGAAELLIAVHEDNGPAIGLYRKLGFEHVVLPDLEPALAAEKERLGRRRVVMRKRLATRA